MTRVAPAALVGAAFAVLAAPRAGAAPASLCSADETAYFACAMANGKRLAVCGFLPGRLQYRFGRPDAIELAHPADPGDGPRDLQLARYHRYRTERMTLRFEREGVSYTVFAEQEDGHSRGGVRIRTRDGREHDLVCAAPPASRLGELAGVVACDRDSALNGGRCP